MSRSAPREQEQSEPGGPGGVRDAEVARQLTRPMAPAAPMPARPSGSEWLAAWLKLGSALCALAAAGLFVRPLVRGEVSLQPRILTLQPTFSSPSEGPPASQELPPDTVTREQRADFDGAILMVESEPAGATVWVDGKDQGQTPVSVGLDCLPGTPLSIEIARRGYETARHSTLCPHDALVKVTARLRKGSGKSSGRK